MAELCSLVGLELEQTYPPSLSASELDPGFLLINNNRVKCKEKFALTYKLQSGNSRLRGKVLSGVLNAALG